MQVTTTFRHMESSQRVCQHALERLKKWRRSFSQQQTPGRLRFALDNDLQSRSRSRATRHSAARPADVVREETVTARTLRVDDAVMQLSLLERDLFLCKDLETGLISVVYRRKDGTYGLIDTRAKVSAETAEKS